jgi:hypothetical protein
MIDTHLHERALKEYELHTEDLWIYTNRSKEHKFGEYKFRQKDWQVRRFIDDAKRGGFALKRMKDAYDDAMKEVERLRDIINKAMQQHGVLEMRGCLFESGSIDAEGQYESGHWEREGEEK